MRAIACADLLSYRRWRSMHENWVFGYGSLMWNPGFRFSRAAARRGSWLSPQPVHALPHVYRGTPDRLGLVLGLDIGGACHGIAFKVADEDWPEAAHYLRAREQVTNMYHELIKPVRLLERAPPKLRDHLLRRHVRKERGARCG